MRKDVNISINQLCIKVITGTTGLVIAVMLSLAY
uniref:Uncharacterized protein n=1 Tax=Arundo donax TaxID=35708 RepID=A0A0A9HL15_ARUDO